ncbi:uncharacterized protein MEPE_01522 [Melanopsichium pennsylvanicum]|uniref:Uncharacterized protein n=1 Tax=Melanopsichium pennsylvanicum TaxID=63383 RepID=A0AAJ5C3N4_9BASI|nr:uncharacterized protein MEPE_01522 [Melanopsichium pennsylvanicum]
MQHRWWVYRIDSLYESIFAHSNASHLLAGNQPDGSYQSIADSSGRLDFATFLCCGRSVSRQFLERWISVKNASLFSCCTPKSSETATQEFAKHRGDCPIREFLPFIIMHFSCTLLDLARHRRTKSLALLAFSYVGFPIMSVLSKYWFFP